MSIVYVRCVQPALFFAKKTPPPLQPPKLSNTPRGHTLAGASPRAVGSRRCANRHLTGEGPLRPNCGDAYEEELAPVPSP